jgi:hypothetical protein
MGEYPALGHGRPMAANCGEPQESMYNLPTRHNTGPEKAEFPHVLKLAVLWFLVVPCTSSSFMLLLASS